MLEILKKNTFPNVKGAQKTSKFSACGGQFLNINLFSNVPKVQFFRACDAPTFRVLRLPGCVLYIRPDEIGKYSCVRFWRRNGARARWSGPKSDIRISSSWMKITFPVKYIICIYNYDVNRIYLQSVLKQLNTLHILLPRCRLVVKLWANATLLTRVNTIYHIHHTRMVLKYPALPVVVSCLSI